MAELPAIRLNAIVTENGVNLDGDFAGRMTVTVQAGHCIPPDLDEDSVLDEIDECPNTAIGKKIDTFGCSTDQNIALSCDALKAKNHGRYVSCVSHVLDDLIDQGVLAGDEEKGQVMNEVAKK